MSFPEVYSVSIESKRNQHGDSINKIWKSPFEFYIVANYIEEENMISEWNDKHHFICNIINTNAEKQTAEFINQNTGKDGLCEMEILKGQQNDIVRFVAKVVDPGLYRVAVNGCETTFTLRENNV